jgi:molybdenum cofactor cytidylyltransferase
LLRKNSIEKLVERWKRSPEKIAALGHKGTRGNPCLFPARFFPELLSLMGDHGGGTVILRHEEDLMIVEADPKELMDVDTPDALNEVVNGL